MVNDKTTVEQAEWQFLFLKTLMAEEPISVKALAAKAGVSESIVTQLRAGGFVKRGTIVKVKDAMISCLKVGPVVQRHQNELIVQKGSNSAITRDQLMANTNVTVKAGAA